MKRIRTSDRHQRDLWLAGGLIILLFIQIPVICLNQNMSVLIDDQLDGELLTYILKAQNPFAETIPELFNGTPVSSMTPPALLMVLLYMVFSPPTALFLQYLIITLVAYLGMFACIHCLTKCGWLSAGTGILFSVISFFPVYGLSVMGQPILFYCFHEIWTNSGRETHILKNRRFFLYYFLIAVFALSSSLILVGYADIIILVCFCAYGLLRKKRMGFFASAVGVLILVYAVSNLDLIGKVLGNTESFVTHKSAYVVSAGSSLLSLFKESLLQGHFHVPTNHGWIIPVACSAMLFGILFRKTLSENGKKSLRITAGYLLGILLVAGFYALWHYAPFVDLRNRWGGVFVEFQADRFYWLYPCLWFILLACSVAVLWDLLWKQKRIRVLVVVAVYLANGAFILNNSNIKVNAQRWLKGEQDTPNYASVTEFFQEDLFAQVQQTISQPKNEYRVISVGLFPSIALYNGFYCLDGYSNNYDLLYKKKFRDVISGELEKDDGLKSYFDSWGNRCYAFSSEIPYEGYISKTDPSVIHKLDYRFDLLKEMGCKYLFSAVPIENSDDIRLIGTFDRLDSYYRVLLYKLV